MDNYMDALYEYICDECSHSFCYTEEYIRLNTKAEDLETKLHEALTQEQSDMLFELVCAREGLMSIGQRAVFQRAFSLGKEMAR